MKRILVTAITMLSTASAQGATRQVATNGSDSGACIEVACATVGYAKGRAAPGDVIAIHGGLYSVVGAGQSWAGTSGVPAAHITIRPFGDGDVIFDGSAQKSGDLVTQTRDFTDLQCRHNGSRTHFRNSATGIGLAYYRANNGKIEGCIANGNLKQGIWAGGDTAERVRNLQIRDNIVFDNARANASRSHPKQGWPAALSVSGAVNAVVEKNVSYQNYGEGIVFDFVSDGAIRENVVCDNYSVGIYLAKALNYSPLNDITVEGNLVYATGDPAFNYNSNGSGPSMDGVATSNEASGEKLDSIVVRNNVVVGANSCFLWFRSVDTKSGLSNARIVNNACFHTHYGIRLGASRSLHLQNKATCNLMVATTGKAASSDGKLSGWSFSFNAWGAAPAKAFRGVGDINKKIKISPPNLKASRDEKLYAPGPLISRACPRQESALTDFYGLRRSIWSAIGAVEVPQNTDAD
jgi:hypothetical protein